MKQIMKKQMFLALMLAFVCNAVFAQAVKEKDGSWTLTNVKLSPTDQKSLVKLLDGSDFSLAVQEGATVKTYGKASLNNVRPISKNDGSQAGRSAEVVVTKADVIIITSSIRRLEVQKQLDGILAKYAKN